MRVWRISCFLFGLSIPLLAQPQTIQEQLGISNLDWFRLVSQSQEFQRAREAAQIEVARKMELKRRCDKLNQLYGDIRDLWQATVQEQQKQVDLQTQGLTDIRQDVLVDKLTKELRDKADELYRLNRLKK